MDKTDFKTMLLLLRGASASVYPSFAEGFGIPPLEAIASGIPTICSNQTAMMDFTFLKKFEFDPNNEIEFNEKLNELFVIEVNSAPGIQGSNVDKYIEAIVSSESN